MIRKTITWLKQWKLIKQSELDNYKFNYLYYLQLVDKIQQKNQTIQNQEKALEEIWKVEELEEYWNNKRVKVNKQHKARDGINMDVRCFFQRDCTLPKFTGSNDEIAKKALGYVIAKLRYRSDKGEQWNYAYETMRNKTVGLDCEDGAILIANLLWNNGVPYWRIRLNKGFVKYKGSKTYHAWCTYLAEDNKFRMLDWCYFPRKSAGLKLKWKDSEDYLSCDCSWNSEFSFGGISK